MWGVIIKCYWGVKNLKKCNLKDLPNYMRERKGDDDNDEIVISTQCKGCYSRTYKARHQIHCGRNSGQVMIPAIAMKTMVVTDFNVDFKNVINKMILE